MSASTMDGTSTPVRVGDKERDDCLDVLTQHHVDGRLDAEELDRRQQRALTATTHRELQALLLDLPRLRSDAPARPRSQSPDGIGRSRVRTSDRRHVTTRMARHCLAAVGVGTTAWLATKGIDDAAVRQMAWNASWVTGASGYLVASLTARWR